MLCSISRCATDNDGWLPAALAALVWPAAWLVWLAAISCRAAVIGFMASVTAAPTVTAKDCWAGLLGLPGLPGLPGPPGWFALLPFSALSLPMLLLLELPWVQSGALWPNLPQLKHVGLPVARASAMSFSRCSAVKPAADLSPSPLAPGVTFFGRLPGWAFGFLSFLSRPLPPGLSLDSASAALRFSGLSLLGWPLPPGRLRRSISRSSHSIKWSTVIAASS
jgi:hypothetical protein